MSLTRCAGVTVAIFVAFAGLAQANDNGAPVDRSQYANRPVLPDFTAAACPDNPRGLTQIKGDLYRHTTGPGLAVHSGLVLITSEGALVIDPAMTCTATWLRDEIKSRFHVPVKYVIYTHGHADHISGAQVFQRDGAIVVANQRALEPIVGEKLPTAVPDRVFDTDMTITLGGETVLLHRVAPSHSDSMTMVLFPKYKALQCTDVCESHSMPYNDFLDFYYDGWIETLDWVLTQAVDVIDVGHYTPATVQDERELRDYMIDLHQQVLDLTRQGQSWDQLYRNIRFSWRKTMDRLRSYAHLEHLRHVLLGIESSSRQLVEDLQFLGYYCLIVGTGTTSFFLCLPPLPIMMSTPRSRLASTLWLMSGQDGLKVFQVVRRWPSHFLECGQEVVQCSNGSQRHCRSRS